MTRSPIERMHGVLLLELAIALLIVSLLTSGLIHRISSQRDGEARRNAEQQLDSALESLLGFAITQGRLPCPALANVATSQAAAGEENCALEHGVLPWRSLGLPETDPWGQRLTYFAQRAFTTPPVDGAQAGFTLDTAGTANVRLDAASTANQASKLPAVILSHGPRGQGGYRSDGSRSPAISSDEAENTDADLLFVSRPPDASFDDLVAWLPSTILNARLLSAGRLP